MPFGSSDGQAQLNGDAPWDDFDSAKYVEKNYIEVLSVDEEIMSIVREHFSDHFRGRPNLPVHGIDVGAGANLYPAFLMLPWCDRITLLDRSKTNRAYLRGQIDEHDGSWEKFWQKLCPDEAYAGFPDGPWPRLREVAQVKEGDILRPLDLPDNWQTGTMFFVAESISTDTQDFHRAVQHFLEALAPGAPFAAAFMEHSAGYQVGDLWFPASNVDRTEIEASIRRFTDSVRIHEIGEQGEVRTGYDYIILACGFR